MLQDTIAAYAKKRAESAPLPLGSAPYTSSNFFKLRTQADKPLANDWTHHLSDQGQHASTSTLKAASKKASDIQVLSLGTARPAPEFYPWESMTMLAHGLHSNTDKKVNLSTSCTKGESRLDLGIALNYGYAAGSPQLVRFITEHVEMIHSPPYQDWLSCLTCSTTSAIDILLRVLCNRDDWVITEEYTYPGTAEAAKKMGLNILSIAMDEQGLMPDDLGRKLRCWKPELRKPSVLYMVPSGQNPTGATQSKSRRQAIYAVAEEHDLLIIEDDPYYFIQLQGIAKALDGSSAGPDEYLKHLLPSYLSMDTSGRVLRLETASKILAPGLRCGWMTGCSQLVSKFVSLTELSTVAPSGPSQIMLYKLLDEGWGHGGFVNWLDDLSTRYRHRLETMNSSCERYLPKSICTWSRPRSGMFLCIQLDWRRHPIVLSRRSFGHRDPDIVLGIEDRIHQKCIQQRVQISKGSWFAAAQPSSDKLFFRITYAATAESELDKAIAIFGGALCDEFGVSHQAFSTKG